MRLRVVDRPIYRLKIGLPANWRLDRVSAPEPLEWTIGRDGEQAVLNLYFAGGRSQAFDVVLSGALGQYGEVESLEAAAPEILSADELPATAIQQTGDLVVEADPGLGVRADKLADCESELLSSVSGWLAPEQQPLARLALRYRTPRFKAQLLVAPRKPNVQATVVSNIRITRRTVEETILLDYTIREAGIRSLAFLLPRTLSDARISAPHLRQQTIAPVADDPAGRVRVRLDLQEEVIGSLRVLVEDDRLLVGEKYVVPIPQLETGESDQRYVTLETAGRDEIVVAEHVAVDPVTPEQSQWQLLSALLGRGLTQAYSVATGAGEPRLVLQAQDRKAVETAGARIGLAKATLAVDAQAAYRGTQLYRLDNSTEQYLVVRLPAGARLWTAHVAGEPVKPAADKAADLVRIPLIKTAAGDADYPVVLTYGGQLPPVGALDRVEFPLVRTVNINVELSQVELFAPEGFRWFDFGGTMRLVEDEGYLAAGLVEYNTKQIGLALQALQSEDTYARARAANNLKTLQGDVARLKQSIQGYQGNEELTQQLERNSKVQQGLEVQLREPLEPNQAADEADNRTRLGLFYRSQSGSRANDVASQTAQNFAAPPAEPQSGGQGQGQGQAINPRWLAKNKLQSDQPAQPPAKSPAGAKPGPIAVSGSSVNAAPAAEQPAAPNAFAKDTLPPAANQKKESYDNESSGRRSQRQLQRYADRLEQQQAAQQLDQSLNAGNDAYQLRLPPRDGKLAGAAAVNGPAAPPVAGAPQLPKPDVQPPQPAGLGLPPAAMASLNVDLALRGQRFLFTTPRGDVEVTARAVSTSLVGRIVRLAALAIGLGLLVIVIRRWRSFRLARNRPLAHTH